VSSSGPVAVGDAGADAEDPVLGLGAQAPAEQCRALGHPDQAMPRGDSRHGAADHPIGDRQLEFGLAIGQLNPDVTRRAALWGAGARLPNGAASRRRRLGCLGASFAVSMALAIGVAFIRS
jgi:hypothetical protein